MKPIKPKKPRIIKNNWESDFDKIYNDSSQSIVLDLRLKDFIRTLLKSARQESYEEGFAHGLESETIQRDEYTIEKVKEARQENDKIIKALLPIMAKELRKKQWEKEILALCHDCREKLKDFDPRIMDYCLKRIEELIRLSDF